MSRATRTLPLYVSPANITIALSPAAAGITIAQASTLSVTTNDLAGVRWTVSPGGGTVVPAQVRSPGSVVFTPSGPAGMYRVTATSLTDPARSASVDVGVTDLAGVFTYRNSGARDGVNNKEYALTPANVNSRSFGKLFSCQVDGAIYAQPLWVANLVVNGVRHNVVYVATAHNGLFAFDADASPCVSLWSASLIDATHGGTSGETSVPSPSGGDFIGVGFGNMAPEVGITGTPVIDPDTRILYVVSKSVVVGAQGERTFQQRLHAIDIATGQEKPGSPIAIEGTFPGTAYGTDTVSFSAQYQFQRPGLALSSGIVYVAWASHEDANPYFGWIMGYRYTGTGFTQASVFNTAPDRSQAGIWMSGGAPAVDSDGNLYVITGNGEFSADYAPPHNRDYGDSLLKLAVSRNPATPTDGLGIAQYFTPSNPNDLLPWDGDFGSGGAAVLADLVAGNPRRVTRLIIGGGKDGRLFILDRDQLGGIGDDKAWQVLETGNYVLSTIAFWNNTIYYVPTGSPPASYSLDSADVAGKFSLRSQATTQPIGVANYFSASPSISASGNTNGIVWTIEMNYGCTSQSPNCGPAILHAYDATDMKELWNNAEVESGTDLGGNVVKFTHPVIANGKVYVPTRGNNTGGPDSSTSRAGQLDIYGLKPR